MTVITRTEPDESARLRRALQREQGPTDEQRDPTYGLGARFRASYGKHEDPTSVSYPFLRLMRRDHGCAMGLHYTESPPLRAQWYFEADDARAAAFADNLVRPIYGSTASIILRFLWSAFSPAVKVTTTVNPDWTYVVDGEPRRVWDSDVVDALVYRPPKPLVPEACRLVYDGAGRWDGIEWDPSYVGAGSFVVAGQQRPSVDLAHSFWAAYGVESEDGNPYGFARLALCAPIFHMYRYIWKLMGHAFENNADPATMVGFPKDEQPVGPGEEDNRSTALTIGRRLRSGATVAIPSDVYEDYQGRSTNHPKWYIRHPEPETNFVAMQDFMGYLETMKFRALLLPSQSLDEGEKGTSSRNVAAVMSSQRDAAQASLMDTIMGAIVDQLVRPAMAVNMPWYQGRLEMRTIGLGKQDDDAVRQIFQLAGQRDLSNFGIDLRRLADSKGFPMLDHAEQERQRRLLVEQADRTITPEVTPTQGRRALVTQTGFGEMTYHQLHDPIDLRSRADGDFVASLPRTPTWEDKAVVDAARSLRSSIARSLRLARDASTCHDWRRELLDDCLRSVAQAHGGREPGPIVDRLSQDAVDDVALEATVDGGDDLAFAAQAAARLAGEARSHGVVDRAVEGGVALAQVVDPRGPRNGHVVAVELARPAASDSPSMHVRPLPGAPPGLVVRRDLLDDGYLALYDEEASVVLLSADISPEQEAEYMLALGDSMSRARA